MYKYNEVSHTLVLNTSKEPVLKPVGASLATIGSNAANFSQFIQEERKKLFKLRRNIGEHAKRVRPCGRYVTASGEFVSIVKGESKNIYYSGLQTCKSVWACPVCSMKISYKRQEEVKEMLTNAVCKDGYKGLFVTLTIPHVASEDLKQLQSNVSEAWRYITAHGNYKGRKSKGVFYKGLKQQFNVQGFIRSLEVTKGANGWHPHLHVCFLLGESSSHIQAFGEEIISMWSAAVSALSGKRISRAAQEAKEIYDYDGIAEYVTKIDSSGKEQLIKTWDIGKEMTKSANKTGAGLSPFQVFERFIETADKKYLGDFLYFVDCFNGVKQLTFSKDFVKRFLKRELASDEQACNEEKIERVLLSVHKELFKYLHVLEKEAEFINLIQFQPLEVEPFLRSIFYDSLVNSAANDDAPIYKLE